MTARARFLLWAPVAVLLAFEFYLSSQSGHSLPTFGLWFPGMDKVEHLAYFFLTGLCAFRAARFGEGWSTGKTAVFLILTGLLWGCSDEIHQAYAPGRAVETGDVLADTAGVALAVAFGERLLRKIGLGRVIR